MKKLMILGVVALTACVVCAQSRTQRTRKSTRGATATTAEAETTAKSKKKVVEIVQWPALKMMALKDAPSIPGGTNISPCYKGRARKWIVLEAEYKTNPTWVDRLTFTWHVLLETASAPDVSPSEAKEMSEYSYFTLSTTYLNIREGSHAASVCLPPSYYERYGEPKAVGLVITDEKGEIVGGDTVSSMTKFVPDKKAAMFWDAQDKTYLMEAQGKNDLPLVTQRTGLLERSKTIWALVFPNDYEVVGQ